MIAQRKQEVLLCKERKVGSGWINAMDIQYTLVQLDELWIDLKSNFMSTEFLKIKEKEKKARGKERLYAYANKGDKRRGAGGWKMRAGGRKREETHFKQKDKKRG